MIKSFRAKNFKSYESINLELGKITILLGKNSSGKSTVMQGILALIQSNNFPRNLTLNGKYVSLGGFADVVTNNEVDRILELGMKIEYSNECIEYNSRWGCIKNSDQPTLSGVSASSKYANIDLSVIGRSIITDGYFNIKESKILDSNMSSILPKIFDILNEFESSEGSKMKVDFKKELKNLLAERKIYFKEKSENMNEAYKYIKSRMSILEGPIITKYTTLFNNIEKSMNYIGNFRDDPNRSYRLDHPSSLKVGRSGERSNYQIFDWTEASSDKLEILSQIGVEVGIFSSVRSVAKKSGQYEIQVKLTEDSRFVNICDVGFGVSQLLPFFVADIQLSNGSTLMVSQPEIHLHPSAQANLGDYLAANTTKREKKYIIETHSEYLVNRIRKLIAEEKIKTNDVMVYYFSDGLKSIGSGISKIELLKDGSIKGAPEEYFNTYMTDIFNIALNAE